MALGAGALVLVPFALVFGSISPDALPWAAGSVGFELAYFALLATAYSRAEVSVVYPVSRGAAPVVVLVAGAALFGASPSLWQVVGVVGVGLGVLLVREIRGAAGGSGVLLALAVACAIAGYTLLDNEGIEHADPTAYLAVVLAPAAAIYLAAVRLTRGAGLRAQLRPRIALAGVGMAAAYALVLAALELAPAAPVAAVREVSVLIATVLAGRLLAEDVSAKRLAGAALIVAGIASIALG